MQNLFDKASLVMVPSGYDNGKLYNIKPEDKGSAFEFERATMATRVNSSGLVETMFPEATNLLLQSNNFDTSPWASISSDETGGQEGYDGTNDAWEVTTTSSTGSLYQLNTDSGVQTFSVYAKSDGSTGLRMYAFGDANANAYFNLNTGAVVTSSNTITSNIENVGGGWYKCSITFNQTNTVLRFYTTNNTTTQIAGTIYIQDAQLESGHFATPYIDTTTQTVTRQNQANQPRIDYTSGEGALLLEPQRTNEYLNSNDFSLWYTDASVTSTANQLASPDGNINATLMSVTNSGRIYYDPTISTTADRVLSIFIKGGTFNHFRVGLIGSVALVDLINETSSIGDINSIGNGWYRVSLPPTSVSSTSRRAQIQAYPNNTYTNSHGQSGTYYIYGAQLEQGSYPTSYIPTNGQEETRAGDVCGTGGYDSVFNNSQGTLYMEFKSPTSGNSSAWINLSSGTDTDDWLFFGKDQDRLRVYLKQNNVLETSDTSTILPTNFAKTSVTYNTSSFKLNLDGVEIFDKNISPNFANNLDTLSFGSTTSTPLPEKIEVKTLCYFPEALTDEELQRLTSPSADATTFTELANNNGYTIL